MEDNLHPNLLPEDYLDEVIGQYFNADSSDPEDNGGKTPPSLSKGGRGFADAAEGRKEAGVGVGKGKKTAGGGDKVGGKKGMRGKSAGKKEELKVNKVG